MPSSLTWFLSRTLVCSTHPPVSVCGTGRTLHRTHGFSRPPCPALRPPRGGLRTAAPPSWRTAAGVGGVTMRSPCPGAGMFTRSPSATPFGLALGPGLPRGDEPGPGNLGFTVGGIPTRLVVTDACIVARTRSTVARAPASPRVRRSPTDLPTEWKSHVVGCPLESRSFSARGFSASGLLRGLQMMAASEPTSWLSWNPHILTIHLADDWGPWTVVWAVPLSTAELIPRRLTPAL